MEKYLFLLYLHWGEKWKGRGKIYFKDYQWGEDLSSLAEVFWLLIEHLLLVDYNKIKPCGWSILVTWPEHWLVIGQHVPCLMRSSPPRAVCDYLCLSLSKYGLLIFSNLGKMWMKTFLTQGAILWVSGVRKWMLSTRTVTQMLKWRQTLWISR